MSNRVWMDLTNEDQRTYVYANGETLTILHPQRVGIKRDDTYTGPGSPDSHVVWDLHGNGVYVARGWTAVSWEGYDATDETFGDRLNEALASGAEEA